MLENIKLMLGLEDDKHDTMIMLFVSKVVTSIVEYCNIKELTPGLESFTEDKVFEIMKPRLTGGAQNTGEVKAVTRGDTKIEYNVASASSDNSRGANLSESDKKFLNNFRVARMH